MCYVSRVDSFARYTQSNLKRLPWKAPDYKLMVINIGELWDRPVPVDDDGLLPPSYSDHVFWESERIYQSHEEYDATDYMHFKCLSPDQAEINVEYNLPILLGSRPQFNDGKELCPKENSNNLTNMSVTKQDAFIHEIPMDSEAPECENICPHASKALRVRSRGNKDRHSKVSTSKGLRDTRVRLSISTALQFYDLQQRLGFDHSSKVIDWLMSKAKVAIDKLPQPSHISPKNCALCSSLATDHTIPDHSQTKPKPRYSPTDLTWTGGPVGILRSESLRNGKGKNPVSIIQNAPPTNKIVSLPNDISVFYSSKPSGVECLTPKSAQSMKPWWFQQTK
ncbi:uncharacterized protein LOC131067842 [Cryptomeria japonica]|uniref:uncharacterized protein LOC131067842 n=1 Tax=Cryptomeria japonica TaxID=3369 RepID=UPI0027DAAC64|nr:uncharacterized protein LOC131067842 [Cryptomeria japonica]